MLGAYLAMATRRRFDWGAWDCLLWLADWVEQQRGVDPAAAYRGRYRTPQGAKRIITRAGGFEALVARMALAANLEETTSPAAGDVGIFQSGGEGAAVVGGLCTGPRWAFLTPLGLLSAPVPFVRAWRV